MGRPTDYTPAIADAICEQLADGMSLRAICSSDDMPAARTVFRWLADPVREEFCHQYARAREAQFERWADEILDIANTPQEGERTEDGENKDGSFSKTVREDMLGHRRLQVDARKWLLSKLAPKKYGNKLELAGDQDNPIKVERIERIIVDPSNRDPEGV